MTSAKRVPAIDGWFTMDEAAPELIATRGVDSGSYFWPPTLAVSANPNAPFEDREPVRMSRTGTLWSYTTNHYAPPEPSVQEAPYTVCAVELEEEQIVVLGPLATGADASLLRLGMTMELVLGPLVVEDGVEHVIYQWSPRA
ncbi:MAG TPA: OB-fold domain-containing protein [Acidimicrobiia bacterium]